MRCLPFLYQQGHAHAQSIVLSWTLSCSSFSLLGVSQKCSQLIHMRVVASLASGLEIRNQLRNRQEKNEFYFQLQRKNFLDSENETRVPVKKEAAWSKESFERKCDRSELAATSSFNSVPLRAIDELTESPSARNFPPL